MQVVSHHDADEVNALVRRQRGFALGHFLISRVNACRIEKQVLSGQPRLLRIGGKGSGDELDLAVQVRGQAMHRANKSAAAAADHPHA